MFLGIDILSTEILLFCIVFLFKKYNKNVGYEILGQLQDNYFVICFALYFFF